MIAHTPSVNIASWLQLIRAEYLEVPGLQLTRRQVERFWGMDSLTCEALLDALVGAGFLRCSGTGSYLRADGAR